MEVLRTKVCIISAESTYVKYVKNGKNICNLLHFTECFYCKVKLFKIKNVKNGAI